MTVPALPPLPSGVTHQELIAAVEAATSWRAVLRALGLDSAHRRRQLQAYCEAADVDVGHFRQRSFSDDQMRRAVSRAASWADVVEDLGLSHASGTARASVRRHCLRLGLSLDHLESPGAAQPEPLRTDLANLRSAGTYLVAAACTLAGLQVSWPLEPAVYDLLADAPGRPVRRIQVKTTTRFLDGTWQCGIARSAYVPGGGKARTRYEPHEVDDFGIVDGELRVYLVPARAVSGRAELSLRRYEQYLLPPPATGVRARGASAGSG